MKTNDPNDIPAPSTIRIGKANVGLIGLDAALNNATNQHNLTEEQAVAFLYEAVSKQNYVPPEAADLYREALRKQYRKRLGKQADEEDILTIRVLGPGCVSCNKLTTMLIEALDKFGLAADMESVHDLDEIWRYGVTSTPALIINKKVKCTGRMPTPAEVEQWVKEEAEGGA